ncbi:MAG: hypothetical protein AMXMBFR7_31370 [Planctomycetota bacterium]
MKKRIGAGLVVIALVACALAGWEYGAASIPEDRFGDLDRLRTAIAEAKEVRILEGLPHQENEYEIFESERAAKSTITRMSYPFYAEIMAATAEDADALTALMLDESNFAPFRGEKKCGGFHPDYAAEWTAPSGKYVVLFCFGCAEIKAEGPRVSIRCDFRPNKASGFRNLLDNYDKQRPSGLGGY